MPLEKTKYHTLELGNRSIILSEDELLDIYEEVTDILMKD